MRYAKGCNPNDLFKSYFTSSAKVRKLIEVDGVNSFQCEVRRIFLSIEDAIAWEHRVLRKILKWDKCLNENAFPAVTPTARSRGNKRKAEIQSSGLTIFQQAGQKWKVKQDLVDPETGLTFRELRKNKYNQSLDKNGTRYAPKADISGNKNPVKRAEVREKISNTMKERIASGEIVPWPTGKKLEYVSKMMKGNNLVVGMKWYNDGCKDYRLLPEDPSAKSMQKGRLFSAVRGKKYQIVKCQHCGREGGGGNMARYHFGNCKHK